MKDLLHCFDWKTRAQQRVGAKGENIDSLELNYSISLIWSLT